MKTQPRTSLPELNAQLRDRLGIEHVARSLVPGLTRVGNTLRADTISGNQPNGPQQAFSIFLNGPKAGRWQDFGAGTYGDLLDLIAAVKTCDVADAARHARRMLGEAPAAAPTPGPAERSEDPTQAIEAARRMWDAAHLIGETHGARYLRQARGLDHHAPRAIRFHPNLWHGATGRQFPALVAAMHNPQTGAFRGVLRLYLDPGRLAKAPVKRARAMRGACGGAAVALSAQRPTIIVCEGLETGLSMQEAMKGRAQVLVAGSISNMGALDVPDYARRIIDARDGNPEGTPAAQAAERATERLRQHGRPVDTIAPAAPDDFNDLHRRDGLTAVRALVGGVL